ncbi:hypothetical protein JTE90_026397 [Oedothorax gibbosus]|uniref:Rab proteins geranylgeranyltransferase component A n=1 Tax=Oedothorax gibbosus TaxID=931172 RepID=A0AAV6VFC6_9ARAC|nr:hypothetical protein JTE90_026397 [Oedothorax gibbosus]
MDELPTYFDIIVIGTGMPECIIAAAAARVGKKVLHMDRNGYYGGDWASFSYDKFMEWMDEVKGNESTEVSAETLSMMSSLLLEDEDLLVCPTGPRTITNLNFKSYVKESPEPSPVLPSGDETQEERNASSENPSDLPASSSRDDGEASDQVPEENNADPSIAEDSSINTVTTTPVPSIVTTTAVVNLQQEWTISSFIDNRRKFNIDLAPKILFSRGSLVELLISSNIARYAEFQCITRVLTYISGHIEQVPCSRADVFSTRSVSVVEKRMLMKFLTFCLKFEDQPEEYQSYEDKTFVEFLRSRKLTSNVEYYVVHAIAMVDENCLTLEGLKSTQKFLQSLGRYGKSPFLCTCYGSAELPQCFCRLCAVYEGMYYLKRKAEGLIIGDHRCRSIISMGQRINCEWLVMESSYAPYSLCVENSALQNISRAILITDASLCPSEKKENTLLRLPPSPSNENPITVLELSSKNYVCPEDLYLVYMSCRSTGSTAEDDLKAAVDLLFNTENTNSSGDAKSKQKPNLLWVTYYNQKDTSPVDLNANLPDGIFLTSSPDLELDYEHAVKQAREIFDAIFPGEEFLPRAPDPEDILIESQNNPGDEGEGGKIENDVGTPEENRTETIPEGPHVPEDNAEDFIPEGQESSPAKSEKH